MIEIRDGYKPRDVSDHGVLDVAGWRLKQYSISKNSSISPELMTAASSVVREHLPDPPVTDERYGVGFMIVHAAMDGNYLLLDWWTGENMLQHRVFTAPSSSPYSFSRTIDGPAMCVWELKLLDFERDAWTETVLASPANASISAYLDRRYTGSV